MKIFEGFGRRETGQIRNDGQVWSTALIQALKRRAHKEFQGVHGVGVQARNHLSPALLPQAQAAPDLLRNQGIVSHPLHLKRPQAAVPQPLLLLRGVVFGADLAQGNTAVFEQGLDAAFCGLEARGHGSSGGDGQFGLQVRARLF